MSRLSCLARSLGCAVVLANLLTAADGARSAEPLPAVSELPASRGLPDPLVMLDGRRVASPRQWTAERRPELKRLFEHYMYGSPPAAPDNVKGTVRRTDTSAFGGKATLKEITVTYGPPQTPSIEVLLVVPNKRTQPAPIFVGMNFCGNHPLVADSRVALSKSWMRDRCPGCVDNQATDAGRGTQLDVWNLEGSIDRGYAVATFYYGDVDPDRPDFSDGVHPHYYKQGQTQPGPHEWGAIAAWAWGISRVIDHLVTDRDLDAQRIAVVGHSRLGKTALLAAAMDERIALSIPHQAGCGGTAPSRGTVGESVERINTAFPHWFNDTFPQFNKQVDRLPFDQHCLVALVAPRPVLFTNAVEDTWANPDGQFEVLQAATPVYRLLGVEGLQADKPPQLNVLVDSRLGCFVRPGKHSMTRDDWRVFWDFADKHLRSGKTSP